MITAIFAFSDPEPRQQGPARGFARQIEPHALEPAHRRRAAEDLFLVVEDVRQIDLDPAQRLRQVHAVGTRVEPGREVDDQIGAAAHAPRDEAIEQHGARDERPRFLSPNDLRLRDGGAPLARERPRERIAEHRVPPLGLQRPIVRDPERGVGDIAD